MNVCAEYNAAAPSVIRLLLSVPQCIERAGKARASSDSARWHSDCSTGSMAELNVVESEH
jgi:hypothetical protein